MRQSGYLTRLGGELQAERQAALETMRQFMFDVFAVALNTPEYMSGKPFGEQRVRKAVAGVAKVYDAFALALTDHVEADVYRERLDDRLRQVFRSGGFDDFQTRYDWIAAEDYTKRHTAKAGQRKTARKRRR